MDLFEFKCFCITRKKVITICFRIFTSCYLFYQCSKLLNPSFFKFVLDDTYKQLIIKCFFSFAIVAMVKQTIQIFCRLKPTKSKKFVRFAKYAISFIYSIIHDHFFIKVIRSWEERSQWLDNICRAKRCRRRLHKQQKRGTSFSVILYYSKCYLTFSNW